MAQVAVDSWLNTPCVGSQDPAPVDRPFSAEDSAAYDGNVSTVGWSINTYPIVSVRSDSSGILQVTTETEGVATFAGVGYDYFAGTKSFNDGEYFDVSGRLWWDGGDPSSATFAPE